MIKLGKEFILLTLILMQLGCKTKNKDFPLEVSDFLKESNLQVTELNGSDLSKRLKEEYSLFKVYQSSKGSMNDLSVFKNYLITGMNSNGREDYLFFCLAQENNSLKIYDKSFLGQSIEFIKKNFKSELNRYEEKHLEYVQVQKDGYSFLFYLANKKIFLVTVTEDLKFPDAKSRKEFDKLFVQLKNKSK